MVSTRRNLSIQKEKAQTPRLGMNKVKCGLECGNRLSPVEGVMHIGAIQDSHIFPRQAAETVEGGDARMGTLIKCQDICGCSQQEKSFNAAQRPYLSLGMCG